jgi:two-component system response regulator HydG
MKNLRILVVDDDRDFAEGVADVLRLHGHETVVAHSGEEALDAFTETEFDLTFMDVQLPGWNGVESFREFRRRFPGAKVVMMTAYGVVGEPERGPERGVLGLFHKPLDFGAVLEVLSAMQAVNRVLVADGDVDFARELRDLLEVAGYTVRSCHDGPSTIQRCAEEPFDAIIVDPGLRGAGGTDVFSAVRQSRPGLPVIAVTASDALAFGTADASGAAFVVRKPCDPGQVVRMVERATATP